MNELKVITVSLDEIESLIKEGNEAIIEELSKQLGETQNQEKEILTRKEVKELLGISYPCMYDWIDSGCLKPYKMGNRTYFKHSEVMEALFNSNRIG
jgi:excisionase family DNA binding protein